DSTNRVLSIAQYASLKHATAEVNGDASEAVSIANTALHAVVAITHGHRAFPTRRSSDLNEVRFLDDGPTAAGSATGVAATHDESSGIQGSDTTSAALVTLFAGVTSKSTDSATDDPSGNIYAQSASAAVTSTSSPGADEEG